MHIEYTNKDTKVRGWSSATEQEIVILPFASRVTWWRVTILTLHVQPMVHICPEKSYPSKWSREYSTKPKVGTGDFIALDIPCSTHHKVN